VAASVCVFSCLLEKRSENKKKRKRKKKGTGTAWMLLSVFSATCWSGTRGGNEKEIEKAGFSLPVGPCDAGLKLSFLRKEKEKEKAACWSVRRGPEAQLF
jgi:hypothetical protein